MANPCVTTTRPRTSSANLSRPDLSGRFKREILKPKRLFVQLNIIYLEADLEEKKKSSFLDDIFAEPKTLRTRETKWNEHFVKSGAFERWHCWRSLVFSQCHRDCKVASLQKMIRVCINKLLVCFLIHKFVIWCIFLFPIFSFSIKVAGENSRTPALSDSPGFVH